MWLVGVTVCSTPQVLGLSSSWFWYVPIGPLWRSARPTVSNCGCARCALGRRQSENVFKVCKYVCLPRRDGTDGRAAKRGY